MDEGFEALFVGYEQGGAGAVVMTNAEGGIRIAQEIMSSIATEYGWPDFRPIVRTSIFVDPKVLSHYVGTYELGPQFSLAITIDSGRLMAQAAGQDKSPLLAESETETFSTDVGSEVEFLKNDEGDVAYMVLHKDGHDVKAMKK